MRTETAIALPAVIAPMLATAGDFPTAEKDWAYEPKWDGIRAVVRIEGSAVGARSRTGQDLARAFPELQSLAEVLGGATAILDGEIVALTDDGVPSFGRLQQRLNLTSTATITRRAAQVPACYLVFDVLHLGGRSLLAAPYDERRSALEDLAVDSDDIATGASYRDVPGREVFRAATERGLEGVVAKRRASTYRPGARSTDWIKIKAIRTQEVVVGGWTPGQGRLRGGFGALLLGLPCDEGLRYVGKVGTGFDDRARTTLLEQMKRLAAEDSPFVEGPDARDRAGAHYLRPSLVGEVQFTQWTRDGRLRHPSWRGVRLDKRPADVRPES